MACDRHRRRSVRRRSSVALFRYRRWTLSITILAALTVGVVYNFYLLLFYYQAFSFFSPRGLIGTACELLSAAVFAGFGSWGLVPCLGQVRSPRTFLIRTVITPAPARSDVRTGDYNVIRRFLSTGSIRRTSSSRSRFKSA